MKFVNALHRLLPEFGDLPKLEGFGGADFSAGRLQANFLPVIAEGAFEGAPILRITLDNTEWTRGHAVSTAVAHIGLDEDAAELGSHDRSGGTGFQTTGVFAVLANVGRKNPGRLFHRIATQAGNGRLLDELDVPPGGSANGSRVVVGEAAPVEAVLTDVVPFFAGYFTGFAANAQCRVG
jgi:hypothetical protein